MYVVCRPDKGTSKWGAREGELLLQLLLLPRRRAGMLPPLLLRRAGLLRPYRRLLLLLLTLITPLLPTPKGFGRERGTREGREGGGGPRVRVGGGRTVQRSALRR